MFSLKRVKFATACVVALFCLSTVWPSAAVRAQGGDSLAEQKSQAMALMKQGRLTDALPVLEKVVAADPNDADMQFQLGFALLAKATSLPDGQERRDFRIRARKAFVRAKELDVDQPIVEALIQTLPPDGSPGAAFSDNAEANALMVRAEGSFTRARFDDALKDYKRALELDPKLYHAALFCGDVYMSKGDFNQAEFWYQKAIAIDPNLETAYRYSATPLMKQGKIDEARDRYVEAFIVEPYSKFARAGLIQWGQATETKLAHPRIDIPTEVTFDEKGDAKVNLDASALLGGQDDGSFAWIAYGATRTQWHKTKFATTFPSEKTYRHSLAEEVDALRSVLTMATADKKTKSLSPALAKLKKLNDEGLLEAYILMAQPDQGIAQDHPRYLKDNRDKLRRYVVAYVLTGGGN